MLLVLTLECSSDHVQIHLQSLPHHMNHLEYHYYNNIHYNDYHNHNHNNIHYNDYHYHNNNIDNNMVQASSVPPSPATRKHRPGPDATTLGPLQQVSGPETNHFDDLCVPGVQGDDVRTS